MRARTTIAATLVVEVALIVVGVVMVTLLRGNLLDSAQDRSELTAREVAAQLAEGTAPVLLDFPDEDLVQVTGVDGQVEAESAALAEHSVLLSYAEDPEESDDSEDPDEEVEPGGVVRAEIHHATLSIPGAEGRHRFAALTVDLNDGGSYVVYSGYSEAAQQQVVQDLTVYMLAALPVILAVVAGTTWVVAGRALRPVAAIRAEMAEITAGDLSRRVPEPPSRDEIQALAVTTNQTLAALDSAVAQQRRFVADASHELRSPLSVLRAQLEVAVEHPHLLDLPATLDDVVRLQALAADLLLLARLDAGEKPRLAPVDLADLVREEVARRAAVDRLPVRLDVADDATALGVAAHLRRQLTNLLDNAQRHARSEVSVTVRRGSGATVQLSVGDDGPGIAPTDRERVFDRFVRLDEARSRDAGGAGMGLAIVRELAAAQGGTIDLYVAETGGVLAVVVLPAAGGPGA